MRQLKLIITSILVFGPMAAQADTITWTLNDFLFNDGGTAVGSFDWDNTTDTVVAWNIDLLPTFAGSPGTYSDSTGSAVWGFFTAPVDAIFFQEGPWQFRMAFASLDVLDTAAAFVGLDGNLPDFFGPAGYAECNNCGAFRLGVNNEAFLSAVVTDPTPVPEPGTLTLLGLGLAGVGLSRRRRKTPSV